MLEIHLSHAPSQLAFFSFSSDFVLLVLPKEQHSVHLRFIVQLDGVLCTISEFLQHYLDVKDHEFLLSFA